MSMGYSSTGTSSEQSERYKKMSKFTIILSLIIMGVLVWADKSDTCEACGEECIPACGTKKFRVCCQNYLRKKRVSEAFMFLIPARKMTKYLEDSAQALTEDQDEIYPNDVPPMYYIKNYRTPALLKKILF